MVANAGYKLAVSTAYGVADNDDSIFSLPRFGARGSSGFVAGSLLLRMTFLNKHALASSARSA
jgi:hypothetical protein